MTSSVSLLGLVAQILNQIFTCAQHTCTCSLFSVHIINALNAWFRVKLRLTESTDKFC